MLARPRGRSHHCYAATALLQLIHIVRSMMGITVSSDNHRYVFRLTSDLHGNRVGVGVGVAKLAPLASEAIHSPSPRACWRLTDTCRRIGRLSAGGEHYS
ncbi:hypothetical protein EJ08DRAFT_393589 [Tothia fuscella]|uniref:Uncharacterized protein n=1 Tax=Tothia fuscella TaxID=1048955 RepID=A0A9P4P204_9PEZI|nr:hypothetical protein EJ08DRAFT_393589 [Tothia fuscella]